MITERNLLKCQIRALDRAERGTQHAAIAARGESGAFRKRTFNLQPDS
jgi:hypothetical protein